MVSIGGIVSLGGGSSGSSGSASGIQSINSQTGPAIVVTGVNGIIVTAGGNTVTIDGAALSGLVQPHPQSGVVGGNGIDVQQVGGNFVVSSSGTAKFAASFSSIISGVFIHGFGTLDIIVQIYDNQVPRRAIMPDQIIVDNINQVSIIFNRPQSGRVVVI